MKYLNTLFLVIICAVCVYLLFRPQKQITQNYTEIIKDSTIIIREEIGKKETRIIHSYESNALIEKQLKILNDSLEFYKLKKDTAKIIDVQEKRGFNLEKSNDTLKAIIVIKDEIISDQELIIEQKDTIIKTLEIVVIEKDRSLIKKDQDIKKIKRQRNVSVALNIIQSVLGVFRR